MKIKELTLKIKFLENIYLPKSYYYAGKLISKAIFYDNSPLKEEHYKHKFKPYVFSNLGYVKDKCYKANKDYYLTLRTINETLADNILNSYKDEFGVIEVIEKKEIDLDNLPLIKSIIPVNPVILIKKDKTYVTFPKDEIKTAVKLLNMNAEKKLKQFLNIQINDDFDFIEAIRVLNKYPITIHYKNNIKMLGYKYLIVPKEDELSQLAVKLFYGIGLGNKNAVVGGGFFNIGV